eukprot:TRINITY_DN22924_c0_g3_i1.p1 TRINITY_DN22924_c0_g3~~TRINITY_DN22924_c0_g3_i1.p1  ORF type:complete len:833 (-),score=67.84 TRINITY_DN22924_c0_g3_i1:165-2294(-)
MVVFCSQVCNLVEHIQAFSDYRRDRASFNTFGHLAHLSPPSIASTPQRTSSDVDSEVPLERSWHAERVEENDADVRAAMALAHGLLATLNPNIIALVAKELLAVVSDTNDAVLRSCARPEFYEFRIGKSFSNECPPSAIPRPSFISSSNASQAEGSRNLPPTLLQRPPVASSKKPHAHDERDESSSEMSGDASRSRGDLEGNSGHDGRECQFLDVMPSGEAPDADSANLDDRGASSVSSSSADEQVVPAIGSDLFWLWWVEPTARAMTCLNVIVAGVRLETGADSLAWDGLQAFFTSFFALELLMKISHLGIRDFYFGKECAWHVLDTIINALAIYELCLKILLPWMTSLDRLQLLKFGDFTFLRIARLIRILAFKPMHRVEMFDGIEWLWSMTSSTIRICLSSLLLFACILYTLAVFVWQLMSGWKARARCDDVPSDCTPAQEVLYENHDDLFSGISQSGFTVLRCLYGDCTLPSGAQLDFSLIETKNAWYFLGLACVYFLLALGIFNIVTAVLVRDTLPSAVKHHARRESYSRRLERIRVFRLLQRVMVKNSEDDRLSPRGSSTNMYRKCLDLKALIRFHPWARRTRHHGDLLVVSKDEFEEAMMHPEVKDMLGQFKIRMTDPRMMFEVLDIEGRGNLHLDDVVDGILWLRGRENMDQKLNVRLMMHHSQKCFSEVAAGIHEMLVDKHAALAKSWALCSQQKRLTLI